MYNIRLPEINFLECSFCDQKRASGDLFPCNGPGIVEDFPTDVKVFRNTEDICNSMTLDAVDD